MTKNVMILAACYIADFVFWLGQVIFAVLFQVFGCYA